MRLGDLYKPNQRKREENEKNSPRRKKRRKELRDDIADGVFQGMVNYTIAIFLVSLILGFVVSIINLS